MDEDNPAVRRRASILTAATVAAGALATTAGAHPPGSGDWLWTPTKCKGELVKYGVRISDGRTFRALSANDVFCGGKPYCEYDLSENKHFYDHFAVALIDRNLVYRTMTLHITQKDNYKVTDIRVVGNIDTKSDRDRFHAAAQAYAAAISRQTQAGCKLVK
jgi:hypothetical protein